MSTAFDVVVVGAGPGGIAAATTASEAGLRVCLLDDNRSPGGQIWRGLNEQSASTNPHAREFMHWIGRLRRTACDVWSCWQVIDSPARQTLRIGREEEVRDIAFQQLILATGARERFLAFPGWTLPGVTGAGGLQALVKAGLSVRGQSIVVAGTGPLLLAIAAGLSDAGARIIAIYEQAPIAQLLRFGLTLAGMPGKMSEVLGYLRRLRGVPYRTGCWVKRCDGASHVERVTITDGTGDWTHDCDWLACGFHLVPNLELPILLGCAITDGYVRVDDLQQTSRGGVACVGELTGIGGLDKALVEGEIAGYAVAGRNDKARSLSNRLARMRRFARRMDRAFALRSELRGLATDDTIVCRCEDVTHAAIRQCHSWREAKLHTRCGMGACQGRICGPQVEFLFGWKAGNVRPPVFPAPLSTVSGAPDPMDTAGAISTS